MICCMRFICETGNNIESVEVTNNYDKRSIPTLLQFNSTYAYSYDDVFVHKQKMAITGEVNSYVHG